ncbi:hypothetical protein WJX74_000965 [Apatococcus lobatus]|uniref:Uncharacterized protein n=1 Tax=Apatococcus lobatus TaxID=904363 RepID=A0AAW1SFC5_9CHLO
MTQLPAPVVRAYDQTSTFVSDFGTWYVAQLYSLAGLFYGAVLGVLTEGKGLLIKSKERVESDDSAKEAESKVKDTAKSAKSALANGYANATNESPQTTSHKGHPETSCTLAISLGPQERLCPTQENDNGILAWN